MLGLIFRMILTFWLIVAEIGIAIAASLFFYVLIIWLLDYMEDTPDAKEDIRKNKH